MTDIAKLREQQAAELELAELGNELVELKASGSDPERLAEVKHRLRELRIVYRLAREGYRITGDGGLEAIPGFVRPVPAEGDAVVAPETVSVDSGVHGPGEQKG